ncbi:MAG TPA: hypothetical protein VFB80_11730 [Pirellulaceae bacterium]|nr:hypothetical protein [Pirellulaceae bacterium]
MRARTTSWWLGVLAASVLVAAGAVRIWQARQSAALQVSQQRYQAQIAALPERQAARLVSLLAEDDQRLEIVARAWADPRPQVARSGRLGVQSAANRWSQLTPEEAAPRVAALASLLARHAPQTSALDRDAARALAQRLLDWPVDSRQIDAARLIGDCDSVLRLDSPAPEELRLAAAPAPPAQEIAAPLPPAAPPPAPRRLN